MANEQLFDKLYENKARVGVIGLGYVGLPLVLAFAEKGFEATGFDIDNGKIEMLSAGKSYIKHIPSERLRGVGTLSVTSDFSGLREMDCIIICVPTPLNSHREPDLSFVRKTAGEVALYLRAGQLVVLESTTYPGTTAEVLLPLFEKTGLRAGQDFFLAYSPEREDPNNPDYTTATTPKIVGGISPSCLRAAELLYGKIVARTVPVSSTSVAEAAKLLENIYRVVNIALVNEMKVLFDRMGIDIWEVIDAARTKPFGFQAFYPGPGLGGHCIPIDPFYLTWKAREYDITTRFIELAGEINTHMPYYVVSRVVEALGVAGKSLKGARLLVLGLAYKKDVDDMRESPSLKIMELLTGKSASVDYNDPYIPEIPVTRKYRFEKRSVHLSPDALRSYDCVLVLTAHSAYDPAFIREHARLIVDTRNLMHNAGGSPKGKIVKA